MMTTGEKSLLLASTILLAWREAISGSMKVHSLLCVVALSQIFLREHNNVNVVEFATLLGIGITLQVLQFVQTEMRTRILKIVAVALPIFLFAKVVAGFFDSPVSFLGTGLVFNSNATSIKMLGILPGIGMLLLALGTLCILASRWDSANFTSEPIVYIVTTGMYTIWLLLGHQMIESKTQTPLLLILCSSVAITMPLEVEPEPKEKVNHWIKTIPVVACIFVATALLGFAEYAAMQSHVQKIRLWKEDGSWKASSQVLSADVAACMKEATVAMEDREFYHHHGFDFAALHRAIRRDFRSLRIAQGGSTITQQAARYTFIDGKKTLSRKIEEALLAFGLEREFTKDEILDIYLNHANYGFDQVGLQSAAHFYFSKSPLQLNLDESIYLVCAVAHPPNSLDQLKETLKYREIACDRLQSLNMSKYSSEQLAEASSIDQGKLFASAKRDLR